MDRARPAIHRPTLPSKGKYSRDHFSRHSPVSSGYPLQRRELQTTTGTSQSKQPTFTLSATTRVAPSARTRASRRPWRRVHDPSPDSARS